MKSNSVFSVIGAFAVVWLILITAPTMTLCLDPMNTTKSAMSVLGPMAESYVSNLQAKGEQEKIEVRLWMHDGDPKLNGCGFYFQVRGYAGGVGYNYFPKLVQHKCGNDKYRMRMSSQSVMYDKTVHLGNEQVKEVQLHADGYHNTYVNRMCFGFNERTIAGGPQAFCVNNELLQACKSLGKRWEHINIEWNDMMFTRTSRGAQKIIFSNIENLIRGFEKLRKDDNDKEALDDVCSNIELVRGTFKQEYWDCPAEKRWTTTHVGLIFVVQEHKKKEDKNPYGCERFTQT